MQVLYIKISEASPLTAELIRSLPHRMRRSDAGYQMLDAG